jgi:hypothetical protein
MGGAVVADRAETWQTPVVLSIGQAHTWFGVRMTATMQVGAARSLSWQRHRAAASGSGIGAKRMDLDAHQRRPPIRLRSGQAPGRRYR